MNYFTAPLIGLLISLSNIVAPILVPFALLFSKWDKEPSGDQWGFGSVIRGDLPQWLSWFSTPDERLPGGMYEPAHAAIYNKYGKWIASWVWLGFRNPLLGMAAYFGKPADDYIPEIRNGFWSRKSDNIWQLSFFIWNFRFVFGYQVYRLKDAKFVAAPVFTIKHRPNNK